MYEGYNTLENWNYLLKLNISISYYLAVPLLGICPIEITYICPSIDIYRTKDNVYSSTICNSPKLETIQMYINSRMDKAKNL